MIKIAPLIDNVNWYDLSANPAAIQLLKEYPNQICWTYLSRNPAPEAIEILEQNLDKIVWDNLCRNPSFEAMSILEANQDKINWMFLSMNPFIFKKDTNDYVLK